MLRKKKLLILPNRRWLIISQRQIKRYEDDSNNVTFLTKLSHQGRLILGQNLFSLKWAQF